MMDQVNTLQSRFMKEDLIAPRVEQAAPEDGLLPVGELERPLSVSLPLWPNARPDDLYQLTWNNALIGEPIQLTPALQPGDILYSHIPASALTVEGTYQLGYRITTRPGAIAYQSQTTPLVIDRTPPGGTLLAALILPPVALDGLSNHELVALGNQLTVTVPGYFDMQWGDVIQSYWGEQAGPSHTVRADQPGSDKVRLSVDRHFLERLGNGEFALSYSVRDRAGNTTVRSQAVTLKLQLQQAPANLQAPLALQLENGQVHDAQARIGVKIAV